MVWTGEKMIVWGGVPSGYTNTGGRYDPVANSWQSTTTSGAPSSRNQHSLVWTGSRMLVWGGNNASYLTSGGLYNPDTNSWTSITTTNSPAGRSAHETIWTGKEMIIWGGYNGSGNLNTGGRFDPEADTWVATSLGANVPNSR